MSQTTKRALAQSLKKLLTGNRLDKITVKDIVEDCGVRRQTFYYHFEDIYDLLRYFFEEEAVRVVGANRTCETWQEGLLAVFAYAQENRPLILNAFHSQGRPHLDRYLEEITCSFLRGVLDNMEGADRVSEEDKAFVARVYQYAFVGLILDWIGGGMRGEPRAIVEKLSTLISGNIQQGLSRFGRAD